ncbi:imelysin family protein [Granulosicoccaceae sp. 1_MG-2023]|nr:imelysin family protein [Granulosicoccaceae sp. 1_MG-2023]
MNIAKQITRRVWWLPLVMSAGVLNAAPSDEAWSVWNEAAIDQHVIPRYQTLAEQSAAMQSAVAGYCKAPDADSLSGARDAYVEAMLAWQGIQHVNFGTVLYLMRDSAMQFWPDRKNVGRRQLRAALSYSGGAYDEEYFRDASISVKGFPALESLLFDEAIADKREKFPRYCELMTAIAGNIAQMTDSIAVQWDDARSQYTDAGHNTFFEEPADASAQILKSLVEPLEVLRDTKILRALDESAAESNWKRSESWRSGISVANLSANVAALEALYQGTKPLSVKGLLEAQDQTALAVAISDQFAQIRAHLKTIAEPQAGPLSEAQWQDLNALAGQIRDLNEQLDEAMLALGINLGFNSRDGD